MTPTCGRPCPLCGEDDFAIVSRKMQHRLNLQTVICKRCSFVYTNPVPTRETYESFYSQAYLQYYGAISGRTPFVPHEQEPPDIKDILDLIERYYHGCGRNLLEVGPGRGALLYWAMQRGWRVLGVEPSNDFCRNMAELNIPFFHGTVTRLAEEETNGSYDIVVLRHVLEHFYSPDEGLTSCLKLLSEGGLLYIGVPNILKPYRSLDHYFLRYVHPSNFSPVTLRNLLGKHGLTILWQDIGGKDWRHPQSLQVLARRSSRDQSQNTSENCEEHDSVLRVLKRYRVRWILYGAIRWYCWYAGCLARSTMKGVARFLLSHSKRGRAVLDARRQRLKMKSSARKP